MERTPPLTPPLIGEGEDWTEEELCYIAEPFSKRDFEYINSWSDFIVKKERNERPILTKNNNYTGGIPVPSCEKTRENKK